MSVVARYKPGPLVFGLSPVSGLLSTNKRRDSRGCCYRCCALFKQNVCSLFCLYLNYHRSILSSQETALGDAYLLQVIFGIEANFLIPHMIQIQCRHPQKKKCFFQFDYFQSDLLS